MAEIFNDLKRPKKQKASRWKRLRQRSRSFLLPILVAAGAISLCAYSTAAGVILTDVLQIARPPINDELAHLPPGHSSVHDIMPIRNTMARLQTQLSRLQGAAAQVHNIAQDPAWPFLQTTTSQLIRLPNLSHFVNVTRRQANLVPAISDATKYFIRVNSGNLTEISDAMCHCETTVTAAVYPRIHNILLSRPKPITHQNVRRTLDACYERVYALLKPADDAPRLLHERIEDLITHNARYVKPAVDATFHSPLMPHGQPTGTVDPKTLYQQGVIRKISTLEDANSVLVDAGRQMEDVCRTHVGRFQGPVDYLEALMEFGRASEGQRQTQKSDQIRQSTLEIPFWMKEVLPPREAARRLRWALIANLGHDS